MAPFKKIQRTCSREISLFNELRPGLLGKIMMPFSMPVLSECSAALFHVCISISLEKLSMICALLNRGPSRVALASGACLKPGVLGFQPASKIEQIVAEIGPVAWFHRLFSFARVGTFFSPDLTNFGASYRH